jgi:hypothetical protein
VKDWDEKKRLKGVRMLEREGKEEKIEGCDVNIKREC